MPNDTTTIVEDEQRPRVPMDPRIRQRRIDVRRDEGRRRLRVIVAALALVAAIGLAWAVTRSPLLDVDHIRITGATHTPAAAVRRALGVRPSEAMVDVDESAAAERLTALPWVAKAEVHRRWPGSVTVVVHERAAVASARAAGEGWVLVDRTGRVLERTAAARDGLPALEGTPGAPAPGGHLEAAAMGALSVAVRIPATRVAQIPVVTLLPDGTLDLVLAPTALGGTVSAGGRPSRPPGSVRFGPATQVASKLVAVFTVLDRVDLRQLGVIDARVPSSPVVIRRAGGA